MKHIHRTGPAAAVAVVASLALAACGGGSGFDDSGDSSSDGGGGGEAIRILIGSSGDAETQAVEEAVAAWSEESGTEASVQAATDLSQELSQGFTSNNPPDVFYVSTDALAGYAANGSLLAYGDQLGNADDFYPTLVDAFTVDDQFYCAPKDFSTLGLVINTRLWKDAGLTDADVPTTWDELADVAKTLTSGKVVGLAFGPEYQRVGSFFPQAGGSMVNDDGTEATVDSPENLEALDFVQGMMKDGVASYSSTLGAGWGGEAFGKEQAAMVIEGNWIAGAMQNDYPDVDYTVAELPEGPAGPGTLAFTNCWGIAAQSGNQEDAVSLVEYLTTADQQLTFADAFGVIPSVQSAAESYAESRPAFAPFVAGAEYAQNPPAQEGAADVISDFNAQLEGLQDGDPQAILESVQQSMQAVVGQ
ncbi:carbohydrate ABC transporter substrate-binding protein, CUT1 family [Nocardioides exalbidus]|uniref:Carbohydrate ABC transporter substrate-binding protein, CUT1 family n=1 Tax=Nocardioides exalbidus TaxID=402596 RepID=A0A1H4TJF2_9ACTN|nr:extracellular solute-binding protein [Nocardioides exalbidus]SEC56214.1 carbohydrate ABC transporter substrate-binding protein, CUT1 family [Nocardioides exalbidus]